MGLLFFQNGVVGQAAADSVSNKGSFDTIQILMEESIRYLKGHDLDGDGKEDQIYFSYSGGAHCCYSPSLAISGMGKTVDFPFEMDGGYTFGMPDGSQPDQFRIADVDEDGKDEILMWIGTYNGVEYDIPRSWRRKWGFRTNHIVIEVEDGNILVRDQLDSEKWKRH